MKINWGTGIVIGMVLFIGFIMTMVVTMITDERYNHEMVTEGYYEKDLAYQNEIDAENNTKALSSEIKMQKTSLGMEFLFPEEMMQNPLDGVMQLYRPSNENLDFDLPLHLNGNRMVIPDGKMVEGQWKVTISWEMQGKPYMFKKDFSY